MEFWPEYWSGHPCPSPVDLPNPDLLIVGRFFTPVEPQGKAKNTGVGSLSLIQWTFLIPESNRGLLPCRRIVYQLSHKGSPRILEWVAYPLSNRSS